MGAPDASGAAPRLPLFDAFAVGAMRLPNRLAVAPMTRVSATEQGCATGEMQRYYRSFAEGGFGLVVTEGIYTDKAWSQGYLRQPGLADSAHADAWRPVVRDVHASGARVVAQLMHAGALSQGNPYRSGTRGPSAVQPKGEQMACYRGAGPYALPQAMSGDEIAGAVRGFADAARRAREAGFDGVEIHAANGYLLDQFLGESTNLRDDRYGGTLQRRLLLVAEVVEAVRHAVGDDFAVGIRISQAKVNDLAHKWKGAEDDAALIFGTLRKLPLDYLHTTEFEAWQAAFGTGPSLAALAKRHTGLPLIANGSLHDPGRASALVAGGEADLVSLGRGALTHADWPRRVSKGEPIDEFDRAILSPLADLANAGRHRAGRGLALG
jgi:2,4-dienoyl-CoA reductase-like NADH-dependent reductase (Old Yellow Enzyme family)